MTLRLGALLLVALSCADDGASGAVEPAFPEDVATRWTEARTCRQSHEHDLHRVRVFASPEAEASYRDMVVSYPVGSTLVKIEYDDDDCTTPVGYTVMVREAPGYAPETFDWRWQKLDANRNVLLDGPYPTRCIACHVNHCQPPRGAGFELTCVDDSGAPP